MSYSYSLCYDSHWQSSLINAQSGETALMKAACNGHTDIAIALMEAGADIHTAAKVKQIEYYMDSGPSILGLDPDPYACCDSSLNPEFLG